MTILPITKSISERAVRLVEEHFLAHHLQLAGALIAAAAFEHKLASVTSNTKHFQSHVDRRHVMSRCYNLNTCYQGAPRMPHPALTKAQQRRLEKLARDAGRTPQAMLRFVLRDGFELCEEDVAAARGAEVELARSGTVPHRQVSNETRTVIANHARAPRRQAA